MKRLIALLVLLGATAVYANPVPPPGLRKVTTDSSLTGTGWASSPLGLLHCITDGDTLIWDAGTSTWGCGAGGGGSGTVTNVDTLAPLQGGPITTTGTVTEYAIPTATSSPTGITTGPDGNIWFAETNANKLGRISPSGVITEFAITTSSTGPSGIAVGSDGNLWFTESTPHNVGWMGTGKAAAAIDPPQVTGSLEQSTEQQCAGERWSTYAGDQPATFSVQWYLDGAAINAAVAKTDKDYAVGRIKFAEDHGARLVPTMEQWQNGVLVRILPAGKGAVAIEAPAKGLQ